MCLLLQYVILILNPLNNPFSTLFMLFSYLPRRTRPRPRLSKDNGLRVFWAEQCSLFVYSCHWQACALTLFRVKIVLFVPFLQSNLITSWYLRGGYKTRHKKVFSRKLLLLFPLLLDKKVGCVLELSPAQSPCDASCTRQSIAELSFQHFLRQF